MRVAEGNRAGNSLIMAPRSALNFFNCRWPLSLMETIFWANCCTTLSTTLLLLLLLLLLLYCALKAKLDTFAVLCESKSTSKSTTTTANLAKMQNDSFLLLLSSGLMRKNNTHSHTHTPWLTHTGASEMGTVPSSHSACSTRYHTPSLYTCTHTPRQRTSL